VVRPELRPEVERVIAGFRQECLRVLDETERVRASLPEPPEGWREYFTRPDLHGPPEVQGRGRGGGGGPPESRKERTGM
jgi:hypothetical protein